MPFIFHSEQSITRKPILYNRSGTEAEDKIDEEGVEEAEEV
jgi:hypothetical protein